MNARWFLGVALVGLWLLMPGSASAANIDFDGTGGSPVVNPDNNFDVTPFSQNTIGNTTTFSGTFVANTPATGSGHIYFTDQGGTVTSDILTLNWHDNGNGTDTVSGSWQVGVSIPTPALGAGDTTLPEGFSGPIGGQFTGLTSNLTLEAETVAAVPEPASLALVVGGLLTFGGRYLVRRRRKA
jgi:PEP-CTERM motif